MIVVTGATGQLGSLILRRLIERTPSEGIAASARDTGKAAALEALGVRVRQGDFADPSGLAHAFEGATQVLIVSSNAAASGGDPLAQHRCAIDAARRAGARRIVYTSQVSASPVSAFPPGRDHAATEAMLAESGLAWTALRNGFYAHSGLAAMGDFERSGRIEAPEDGKTAWTTHRDLAEAAAEILLDEGRFDGPTPPLTGGEALDLADLATLASAVLGRPITRRCISDEELRGRLSARGVPPSVLEIAAGNYRASRAGEFATVDPTLETLLGRRPETMRDVIARRVSSGRDGQA